jgi:hypothetical protein
VVVRVNQLANKRQQANNFQLAVYINKVGSFYVQKSGNQSLHKIDHSLPTNLCNREKEPGK